MKTRNIDKEVMFMEILMNLLKQFTGYSDDDILGFTLKLMDILDSENIKIR